MYRPVLVAVAAVVAMPSLAHGADSFIAVGAGKVYAKPSTSAASISLGSAGAFKLVAKRGAWYEVQAMHQWSCVGNSSISAKLRVFVPARSVLQVVKSDITVRGKDGSFITLHAGYAVKADAAATVADIARRAGLVRTFRIRKPTRAAKSGRHFISQKKLVARVGKLELPLAKWRSSFVVREAGDSALVEQRGTCSTIRGWLAKDRTSDPMAGGVLGGFGHRPSVRYVAAGTLVTWPDGTRAGTLIKKARISSRLKYRGRQRCAELKLGYKSYGEFCFASTAMSAPTRPGSFMPPPPPRPPRALSPKIVPSVAVEQRRVAGKQHIHPPKATKLHMAKYGKTRIIATMKMCLDRRGAVSSLRLLKSSGYVAYDRLIRAEMKKWRYRPFTINHQAVAVCTAVTFIYRQRN